MLWCGSFHGAAVDATSTLKDILMIAVVLQIQLKWIPNNFNTLWGILWLLQKLCCGYFHGARVNVNTNFLRYPMIAVVLQIQLKWIPNSMNVNENITLAQGKTRQKRFLLWILSGYLFDSFYVNFPRLYQIMSSSANTSTQFVNHASLLLSKSTSEAYEIQLFL